MSSYLNGSVIAGVAEAGIGDSPGLNEIELHAMSAIGALEDAGISKSEVDGVLSVAGNRQLRRPSLAVSEYLGIRPDYSGTLSLGGASPPMLVLQAMAAINAGLCSVCLVTYGSTQRMDRSRSLAGDAEPTWMPRQMYESRFRLPNPVGSYALVAQRYNHVYRPDPLGVAQVAVTSSEWARLTPNAFRQDPITIDDVLRSPMVASPLRKLDCCLVTDGAGSIVVARADRISSLASAPVRVLGSATATSHEIISQMADFLEPSSDRTIPQALRQAGLSISDIDVAQLYDSFSITLMLLLESTGVCGKGEAADFIREGGIGPGGTLPTNTNGGGLSYAHPGINGALQLIEGVRQLRGACADRQVAGAETALCHAVGGVLSSHCTLVLGSA